MPSFLTNEHLNEMRQRAVELVRTDPEAVAWFRYGATYVVSLLAMIQFYGETDRREEAADVLLDLKQKLAAADCPATIVKNMLRLGLYWDEATQLHAAGQITGDEVSLETLLDVIRNK